MSAPAVALVMEPADAEQTRKTRWYARFRALSDTMKKEGASAHLRAVALKATFEMMDRASRFGTRVTAQAAARAVELIQLEDLAEIQDRQRHPVPLALAA